MGLFGSRSRFHNFPLGKGRKVDFPLKLYVNKLSEEQVISQVIHDQTLARDIFEKARVLFIVVIYGLTANAEELLRQAMSSGINNGVLPIEDKSKVGITFIESYVVSVD